MPFKNFPIGGTFPLRGGHTPSKALSIRGQKQLNRRRTSRRWLLLCVALPSRPAQVTRYSSGCGFSLWPPSRQRHACRQESRAIYLGACLGLFWVLSLCPCCRNALEYLPSVQTSQSAAPSQAPACKPPNRQHPVRLQPAVVEGTTPIVGTASLLSSHKAAPAAVPFLLPSGLECDSVETV